MKFTAHKYRRIDRRPTTDANAWENALLAISGLGLAALLIAAIADTRGARVRDSYRASIRYRACHTLADPVRRVACTRRC